MKARGLAWKGLLENTLFRGVSIPVKRGERCIAAGIRPAAS